MAISPKFAPSSLTGDCVWRSLATIFHWFAVATTCEFHMQQPQGRRCNTGREASSGNGGRGSTRKRQGGNTPHQVAPRRGTQGMQPPQGLPVRCRASCQARLAQAPYASTAAAQANGSPGCSA